MRVGIVSWMHESNTFLPAPTTLDHFKQWHLLTGEAVRDWYAAAHHELGGMLAGLEESRLIAVPLLAAWALPGGTITADAYNSMLAEILSQLDHAGPLDGLLVAPHGAGVSEVERDMDGGWLTRVREFVGPQVPIISTLDPHGNVSPRMVAACDAMMSYRSNPHLDQRERGMEAARLMARTLRGEVHPVLAGAFPPIAINIERQLTAASPCKELIALADEQRSRPGMLSNSVVLGFPYADCEEMGTSFLAVADGDRALAQRAANELADYLWKNRQDFVGQLVSIDEAVRKVAASQGPIGLLDMGDNVGGGSPGDSTALLHALIKGGISRSLACLSEAAVVQQAQAAGVGGKVKLSIGGKIDRSTGEPIVGEVTVVSLHDGKFSETEPRHGGQTTFDMGPTAVVRLATGQTILVSARRMAPFSLMQVTSCGLNPADFQAIVIKGVHAPVAAYAPVCRELMRVDTPGVTCADMTKLKFDHRRKPLYPFEKDFEWSAAAG